MRPFSAFVSGLSLAVFCEVCFLFCPFGKCDKRSILDLTQFCKLLLYFGVSVILYFGVSVKSHMQPFVLQTFIAKMGS